MKTLTLLFAVMGMAKYCSKPKEYSMPVQKTHKEKLTAALQPELRSSDSLQKAIAEKLNIVIDTDSKVKKNDLYNMIDEKIKEVV